MTASVAEAYMLILRPVPILGEAWAIPFNGQIYIDDWKWTLTPAEGQRRKLRRARVKARRLPRTAPVRHRGRAGRNCPGSSRRPSMGMR